MTWYQDPREFVRRFEAAGWNLIQLAAENGISNSTANTYRRKHADHITIPEWVKPKGNHRNNPSRKPQPPLVPIQDEPLRLEGDFAVSSDWHAPLIHYDTFHRMLDGIDKSGLRRLIVAGDLTNQDALACHEDKQAGAEMPVEIEHLHYAVDTALDVVDELIVTLGNHDRHTARQVRVDFDRSIRMLLADLDRDKLARITVTGRDGVIVDTERGPWNICHTRSYSRIAMSYPMKLAVRHNMHVAAGHRHHYGICRAPNGKDAVELGGLMDVERMAYVHRYTNDLPEMQNGYGLLIDGRMRLPML